MQLANKLTMNMLNRAILEDRFLFKYRASERNAYRNDSGMMLLEETERYVICHSRLPAITPLLSLDSC